VGAGRVGELVFLAQIGARELTESHLSERRRPEGGALAQARAAFVQLRRALAHRELLAEDLLRLRLFTADLDDAVEIERALEELLPRRSWPAVTIVELPVHRGVAQPALTLDAVAAPGAHAGRQSFTSVPTGGGAWADAAAGCAGDRPLVGDRPHAVRFGPWVFVGATSGARAPAEESLARRIETESRSLFTRIEELLRAAGASLGDVVKVGGWLTFSMARYEPLGEVRGELLARHGLLPASSAARVGRVGPSDPLLAFEAIAYAPEHDADPRRTREQPLATPSPLASYYATARRAGAYVFTCGEISSGAGPADAQTREVYELLRAHLDEHGAAPADVIHQTVFVRRREDLPAVEMMAEAFSRPRNVPISIIPTTDIGFRPGVDVEIELVAACRDRRAR
jgi:2-iminobutanoate/2-iminopropanoate deaminase